MARIATVAAIAGGQRAAQRDQRIAAGHVEHVVGGGRAVADGDSPGGHLSAVRELLKVAGQFRRLVAAER